MDVEAPDGPPFESDSQLIMARLARMVAERACVAADSIDVTVPFDTYGISSTDAVSISGEIEDWCGRKLSATIVYQYPTIRQLADFLAEAEPAPTVGAPARPGADDDPVCVVGMACRFPGGANSPELFWSLLLAQVHTAAEVPADRWDAKACYAPEPDTAGAAYTKLGSFLDDLAGFDPAFFRLSPREALRMDPRQRHLLEVSWEALEDAGIAAENLRGSRTGVFVGSMADSQYAALQIECDGGVCLSDPYFGTGAAPSVFAGRLSYLLDLRGPSLFVDTACSSSLVAAHLARESLRRGECDLALVGGASALVHRDGMIQACAMRMLAPDGRCKTFDAAADGFLMGEGCGVVVLERRSDALARGHHVYAVLRGSAVNQDGQSNGLTAPNAKAQQAVIRDALAVAGISPGAVGYVESHGSGTLLGDSLEMASIQEVFGPGRAAGSPLVVGAVKTNIGHLLGAAGMAGLIKAVLAVRHGVIPANLHYSTANPAISFDRYPIMLPASQTAWPPHDGPRLAGVSSFGWSGTNAHVIVAAEPPLQRREPDPSCQVLTLSARSHNGITALAGRLLDRLRADPGEDLADVAFTVQTGRSSLEYRTAVVCRGVTDACAALAEIANRPSGAYVAPGREVGVALLLPGAGDHYPGMGRDLYAHEDAFRAAIDECAQILAAPLGLDLREVLFRPVDGPREDGPGEVVHKLDLLELLGRVGARERLADRSPFSRLDVTHGAVFAVDYACAQLWRQWGVDASALLGYSLGEYVAACLSGVFSLEDALLLVARRAQLIQRAPEGVMLAVAQPAADLRQMLGAGLSLAAVNGPQMSVVAGTTTAVAALEESLTNAGIAHRRVRASHAMHSAQLEPLRDDMARLARAATARPPRIPFVSNVTGTWITEGEATDPRYWAAHLCQAVQFAPGVIALAATGAGALLEAGPGQTLCSLSTQILAEERRADIIAVPTLRPDTDRGSDRDFLLGSAGRLWTHGVNLDWQQAHRERAGRTVSLPTYPFAHTRYWPAPGGNPPPQRSRQPEGKLPDLADWCSVPVWRQAASQPIASCHPADGPLLLFADELGVSARLTERLRGDGRPVITVSRGRGFQKLREDAYIIDAHDPDDYRKLLAHLASAHQKPAHLVHAWSLRQPGGATDVAATRTAMDNGFFSLLMLLQAMEQSLPAHRAELISVSNNVMDVLGTDARAPEQATMLGIHHAIRSEYPHLTSRYVDLSLDASSAGARAAADALIIEVACDAADEAVAWRGRRRFVRSWERRRVDHATDEQVWRHKGIYLITGGTGGLGLILARHLARTVKARIALLARSVLPPRDQWDDWCRGHAPSDPVRRVIDAVADMEAQGAEVLLVSADCADPAGVDAALEAVRLRFGPPHGVIHAAGVPGTGLLQHKSSAQAATVLRAKVQGTLVLAAALRDVPLDFFVLYSSSVIAGGGPGESDYCAANAFLDAYAQAASAGGGRRFVSVSWSPWRWDAWQSEVFQDAPGLQGLVREFRDSLGVSDAEGTELLTRILAARLPHVLVLTQDLQSAAQHWVSSAATAFADAALPRQTYDRPALRTPYVAPRDELEELIATVWQEHLGLTRVGMDDPFFELGGNSLVGMAIVARLTRELGTTVSAASLLERPTVGALAVLLRGDPDSSNDLRGENARGERRRRQAAVAAQRRKVRQL